MGVLQELFAHLFWPQSCPVCGRAAVPVCDSCLDELVQPFGPCCVACGEVYPCSEHPALPPHYFACPHKGPARELVLQLKYRKRRILGKRLGEVLARAVSFEGPFSALVPVPLHRGSRRPYNQALEICKGMGQVMELDVADVLLWSRWLPPQAGGSAEQRRLMPDDSMICMTGCLPTGRVVLVDDVRTTGTTLLRGRSALEKAGIQVGAFLTWSSA